MFKRHASDISPDAMQDMLALAAAHQNPLLKPAAQRLKKPGKPHKTVIVAVARGLVTIANAILKSTTPWQTKPAT